MLPNWRFQEGEIKVALKILYNLAKQTIMYNVSKIKCPVQKIPLFIQKAKIINFDAFFQIGAVDLQAFDKMIETAAAAPRKFGLAPNSSELFATEAVSFGLLRLKWSDTLL